MSTSRRVSDLFDSINKIDRRILAGYVLGGLVFTVCVIAAAIVPPSPGLQIVLCFFGGVLGWVIGIASTPLNTGEKERFTDFATAVSAFVSGFVIAKLGVIADQMVGKLVATDGEVLLFRTLLFGTCLLIGFLFPFINRLYLQQTRLYLQQTPGKSPAPSRPASKPTSSP